MDIPVTPGRDRRRFLLFIGLALGAALMLGLSRLGAASPAASLDRLVVDTVRRGVLVMTTRGPGTLEPENQQHVPALTSGRVDRRLVVAGERVRAGQVLLELSNPDVSLELLQAQRELAQAEMALVSLDSRYELDALAVDSEIAALRGRIGDEKRLADALSRLAGTGGATEAEAATAGEAYAGTARQLEIAARRRSVLDSTHTAARAAQRREIDRLETIARFRRERVESLRVTAARAGVVAEMPVEQGQWVNSGGLLGRLILDGGLKAEIRVPERSAGGVRPGMPAAIDLRGSVLQGVVRRIDPSASGGTVAVEIALRDSLPTGARPDQNVEGTIELGRLTDVLHVARPARALPDGSLGLHRLTARYRAELVTVATGAASADRIVVREGLDEGDVVIVSDLGELSSAPTIKIQR